MAEGKLIDTMHNFRRFVTAQGWAISAEKEIAHGYQFIVSDGQNTVPVTLYATGKVLIQGRTSPLQASLKTWDQQRQQIPDTSAPVRQTPMLFALPTESVEQTPLASMAGIPRIGSDESGKGDFFGPLVVAAVCVHEQTEQKLLALGVRDSKKLTDTVIQVMAEQITALCPTRIATYLPEQYNQIYHTRPNLNTLLAETHTRVITELEQATTAELVIVDQFGDAALMHKALQQAGCPLKVVQRYRAEEDTAVAAASIVARAEFVQQLHLLSRRIGLDLPKGASNPNIIKIGREIAEKYGTTALRQVAKLHFKTMQHILNPETE